MLLHPVHGVLIECPIKYVGDSARYKKAHYPDENRVIHDLDGAELLVPESLLESYRKQRAQLRNRLGQVQAELAKEKVRADAAEKRERTYSPTELLVIVSSLSIVFSAIAMVLLGWRGFWVADLLGLAAVLGTYSLVCKEKKGGSGEVRQD